MRTASPLGFVLSHMRIRKEKPLRYEALTGLTRGQLTEVAARVATAIGGVVRPGGRPAAAGVLCAFPAWWTHYLNSVSAADSMQILLSLLF